MLKIGDTPFRNTAFPYYFLKKNYERYEKGKFKDEIKFYTTFPPQLGEMVLNNKIDIAPISSIIYAKHPQNFLILPNFSISAKGKTGSIILVSKFGMEEMKEKDKFVVSVSTKSASSVALLKIISNVKGINVELKTDLDLDKQDGVLLIGDDGIIACEKFKNFHIFDLGEEWNKITGKGMVYAMWLVSKKSSEEKYKEIKMFSELLTTSIEQAYENFENVITEISGGLKREAVKFHISNLSYNLKKEEVNALTNFYEYARTNNIIANVQHLNFLKF